VPPTIRTECGSTQNDQLTTFDRLAVSTYDHRVPLVLCKGSWTEVEFSIPSRGPRASQPAAGEHRAMLQPAQDRMH
jgi:hypothetical protein